MDVEGWGRPDSGWRQKKKKVREEGLLSRGLLGLRFLWYLVLDLLLVRHMHELGDEDGVSDRHDHEYADSFPKPRVQVNLGKEWGKFISDCAN